MSIGYIDFGGEIKGNSDDANHKGWIEISMVSQGVNRNINPSSKPKEALSKSQVQVGAIEIQKNADESSPELVAAVCAGKTFPKVTIDLVKVSENGNEVFYQWELEDAYIANYGMHGQGMGGIETSENLSLCYNKIKWSYKKTNEKGKPDGSVDTGWDLGANKKA